jgi:hypothetical protein
VSKNWTIVELSDATMGTRNRNRLEYRDYMNNPVNAGITVFPTNSFVSLSLGTESSKAPMYSPNSTSTEMLGSRFTGPL